jgi:STE24 endopeptidase
MTPFDPAAATAAYLATLSPAAAAKAIAYTRGGHWLILWGFLVDVVAALLILKSGLLPRVAAALQKRRPRPWLVAFVAGGFFIALNSLIELPWSIYTDWWREKTYGLTSQAFGGWLSELAISVLISVVGGGLFVMFLYALIRRAPRFWWAWSGALAAAFILLRIVISPPLIEPIFNHYTPAPSGAVRDEVVALAKVSGVPSDKIFIYNGSKQSNRYTANVSGVFGSARVAMSDVMFQKGADLTEVRGVVGHEMGHYAHNHSLWMTAAFSTLAVLSFWLTSLLFPLLRRWTAATDVAGIADPSGLPLLMIALSIMGLLATPITNTLTRTIEADADHFSLVHANEPDGLSKALIKTVEYRAASPGRLEEIIFYDHPSVSRRIRRAMDWKATHPATH